MPRLTFLHQKYAPGRIIGKKTKNTPQGAYFRKTPVDPVSLVRSETGSKHSHLLVCSLLLFFFFLLSSFFFPSGGLGMTDRLSWNFHSILYHIRASKFAMEKLIRRAVGLQYLENDPETPIFADFHRCSTGGSIFHCVLLKTNIMYCGKPYPQRCLTSAVRW